MHFKTFNTISICSSLKGEGMSIEIMSEFKYEYNSYYNRYIKESDFYTFYIITADWDIIDYCTKNYYNLSFDNLHRHQLIVDNIQFEAVTLLC